MARTTTLNAASCSRDGCSMDRTSRGRRDGCSMDRTSDLVTAAASASGCSMDRTSRELANDAAGLREQFVAMDARWIGRREGTMGLVVASLSDVAMDARWIGRRESRPSPSLRRRQVAMDARWIGRREQSVGRPAGEYVAMDARWIGRRESRDARWIGRREQRDAEGSDKSPRMLDGSDVERSADGLREPGPRASRWSWTPTAGRCSMDRTSRERPFSPPARGRDAMDRECGSMDQTSRDRRPVPRVQRRPVATDARWIGRREPWHERVASRPAPRLDGPDVERCCG
jgi:hypothetical protein